MGRSLADLMLTPSQAWRESNGGLVVFSLSTVEVRPSQDLGCRLAEKWRTNALYT